MATNILPDRPAREAAAAAEIRRLTEHARAALVVWLYAVHWSNSPNEGPTADEAMKMMNGAEAIADTLTRAMGEEIGEMGTDTLLQPAGLIQTIAEALWRRNGKQLEEEEGADFPGPDAFIATARLALEMVDRFLAEFRPASATDHGHGAALQ